MSDDEQKYTTTIEFAWWWTIYFNTILCLAHLFNQEPNMERFRFWMDKAIRLRQEKSE